MVAKSEEHRGRRVERMREDILLAAARALGANGYAQVTMADIAAEAGCTVPSLYAYYPSKDQIVEGLGAMVVSEVLGAFEEDFPAGLTSAQRLELLLRRIFAVTDRRREALATVFALPSRSGEPSGREVMEARMARWLREHEPALARQGRQATERAAVALMGLCNAFLHRWIAGPGRSLFGQQAPLVANLFLYGVQGKPPARGK